jgi:DNA-binding CsgD family transcriptional regulator
MERLKGRDLRQLLEFSRGLLALRNAEAFREYLLHNLRAIASNEFSSYGEIDPTRPPGEMGQTWIEPIGLNPPEYTEWSQKLFSEEPTWLHFKKAGTSGPLTHSDFYSERQYRDTEHYALYNELGGPIRDMIVALQAHPSGLLLNFGAARGKRYSDRDRLMFAAIAPHVFQASLNLKAFSDLSGEVHQLQSAIETVGRAVVIVSQDFRVTYASDRAALWMEEYFGDYSGNALPERVDSWLRRQLAKALTVDDVGTPTEALKVRGPAGFIVTRLASLPNAWLLLLEREGCQLDSRTLQTLPITRREAEVLAYIANGKTNPEIATILGISRLTVKKHLEHIFQALSVETRTAAAAVALQVASSIPQR